MSSTHRLVSLVSSWYHDTNDTSLFLVSLVSSPFRDDTNDTKGKFSEKESFIDYSVSGVQPSEVIYE